MPAPGHDRAVEFADTVVAGDVIDISAWECWIEPGAGTTRHYYARGPCPACHARTQGHIADHAQPIDALGRDTTPRAPLEPVEIPVRCACGHDHGSEAATGCGRRWSIICPRQP